MLAESAPAAARKNPTRSRPLADSNAGLSNPRFQTRLPPNPGAPPGFVMQGPAPASLHRVVAVPPPAEDIRIFVYPLQAEARQRLCEGMLAPVPASRIPAAPQDWAEAEFGSVDLKDRRLNRRAVEIARDFYGRPQAQIPQACQSRARTKAAYRFFKHPNTNMDDLLEPHRQSTYQRIVEKKIVLCPQDTTSLNYSTHPATENLGPIGSTKEGIIGLIVHDTMAFSIEGTPLGLLDVQCWARDADEFGKKQQRKQRPI